MEIYLIRHTTPDIAKGICYGQADIGLTESFSKDSDKAIKQLPPLVDKVYTSPLKRCVQLARLIPGKDLEEVPQLQEMDFGDWELKAWSDIPKAELDPWMEDFVNQPVPNGESMNILSRRVVKWFKSLAFPEPEKVAIVTHAGPIRIILSEVNQTPLEEAFQRYSVNYGEIVKLNL